MLAVAMWPEKLLKQGCQHPTIPLEATVRSLQLSEVKERACNQVEIIIGGEKVWTESQRAATLITASS